VRLRRRTPSAVNDRPPPAEPAAPAGPGRRRARRGDRPGALVLAGLGALALVEAARIPDTWLGARLLPLVVGTALVLLGAAHLTLPPTPSPWPDARAGGRAAFVFAALVLYVALLTPLGFLPATVLWLLALFRALGALGWPAAGALALALALASHVVFRRWLGMPLPPGLLGG